MKQEKKKLWTVCSNRPELIVDGFGPNRLELIPDGFKKTVQNWLGTVLAKPSEIADGLAQTVHNPN